MSILSLPVEVLEDGRGKLQIDEVTYFFTMANGEVAWKAFKQALSVLKGAPKEASILGYVLGSLGDPAMGKLEELVRANTVVHIEGQEAFKLTSPTASTHFNTYRKHVLRVMMAGTKFQFEDFLDASVLGL